jgi:hypothetical protein
MSTLTAPHALHYKDKSGIIVTERISTWVCG